MHVSYLLLTLTTHVCLFHRMTAFAARSGPNGPSMVPLCPRFVPEPVPQRPAARRRRIPRPNARSWAARAGGQSQIDQLTVIRPGPGSCPFSHRFG